MSVGPVGPGEEFPAVEPESPSKIVTNDVETVGASPKALIAAALPLVVGLVLLILDKVVLGDDLDDSVWTTLIATSPVVGLGAAAAKPGTVKIPSD